MQVKEIMTESPQVCTPAAKLKIVARLMRDNDCGAIPVVKSEDNLEPVGIVTDRDIACKVVAEGKSVTKVTASDIMTSPCVTVSPEMSLEECCKILEEHQVRRVLVVDDQGACCGIVAQADIARKAPEHETAAVVRELSQPAMV